MINMEESEPFTEDEACLARLKSMFYELAVDGRINESNFLVLCDNLCLDGAFKRRLNSLLFGEKLSEYSTITFHQFEEDFVSLLSDVSGLDDDGPITIKDINENSTFNTIQDVPPKLVRHGRSYGRRSIPIESTEETEKKINLIEKNNESFDYKDEVFEYSEPNDTENDNALTLDMLETPPKYDKMNGHSDMQQTSNIEEECEYINSSKLLKLWLSKHIEDPHEIIKSLGIDVDEKFVHLESLTELLERKISHSKPIDAILKALIATYKHHIQYINHHREQAIHKMTKMKRDLVHSESRNTSLIAEAEDRYTSKDKAQQQLIADIERKWSKRLQMTKLAFDQDRESLYSQWNEERVQLNAQIDEISDRERSLLRLVEQNKSEISAMEQESSMLVEKLQMSEKNASRLKKDLECLLNKADSSKASVTSTQEEKFALIIKEYEAHCRELSDRNDELVSALEEKNNLRRNIPKCKTGDNVAFSIGDNEENIKNISQQSDSSSSITEIKISGLEKALKEIHNEKENIEQELNKQKNELEKEISKLKADNQRLLSTNKNSVNQALSDAMKEKDEVSALEKRISQLEDKVSEKTKAFESVDFQLKQEKERHLAAIAAHNQLVQNMKNAELMNTSHLNDLLDERDAMWKTKEEEMRMSHIVELEKIRGQLQDELNLVLTEKDQIEQDRISLCSELDRVQSTADEQKEILESKIDKLRENFRLEFNEINSLMQKEKDEMKQKMIDEGIKLEKEITLREKQKLQSQYDKLQKREDHYSRLEELNKTLQSTNFDLEQDLKKAKDELSESTNQILDMKNKNGSTQKHCVELENKISEMSTKLFNQSNKEDSSNKRITLLQKEIARLEVRNQNISSSEVQSLLHQKEDLARKVSEIEAKFSHQQMENARLVAKNYHLTKSDNDSAVLQEVHQRIEKKETENLKSELSKKIEMQRALEQKIEDLNVSDNLAMKARLKKTREQLIAQIQKTKDVYKIVSKNEKLLKSLYVENAELMKALQVTEQRQRDAERRSTIESDKNVALMMLLRQVCPDAI